MNWRCLFGHKVTPTIYPRGEVVFELIVCDRPGCNFEEAIEHEQYRKFNVDPVFIRALMARKNTIPNAIGFRVK